MIHWALRRRRNQQFVSIINSWWLGTRQEGANEENCLLGQPNGPFSKAWLLDGGIEDYEIKHWLFPLIWLFTPWGLWNWWKRQRQRQRQGQRIWFDDKVGDRQHCLLMTEQILLLLVWGLAICPPSTRHNDDNDDDNDHEGNDQSDTVYKGQFRCWCWIWWRNEGKKERTKGDWTVRGGVGMFQDIYKRNRGSQKVLLSQSNIFSLNRGFKIQNTKS